MEEKGFNIGGIAKIIVLIVLIGSFFVGGNLFTSESDAIESAEKMVNHEVYRYLGLVPERFDSEVIYKDGDNRLIQVRYSLDKSREWDGTCCVYTIGEYARNCTTIMGPGYDFKEDLAGTKALFGL